MSHARKPLRYNKRSPYSLWPLTATGSPNVSSILEEIEITLTAAIIAKKTKLN
jgi:hypothetical protein